MLLTESEKAKQVRARILDIVISTINKRAGGGTKYINTRDIDFLPAAIEEDNYRKNFTTAVGGGIRKVLDFVQNDLYYPTFVDKLTYLVFGLCTGHYFEDSNKRVALTIGVWFLVHNGYYWHAYGFMQCMEAIIYHVAAGRIDKDLLQRIITCYMANEDYPESLKLEIIHAIDNQPTGIDE